MASSPGLAGRDASLVAAKQDWQIFDNYVDSESGSTSDRPEFQRMFADASKRKFDLVLFWALDRFSREGVLDTGGAR